MRALRLLILLLPAVAFAGWHQLGSLSGTSQDVVVADAGLVVATGTTGVSAWKLETDGGVSLVNSLAGAYVGAGLFDGGCIAAFESSNNIVFSPGCGTSLGTGSTTARRLRVFGGDQLVFVATTGAISDSLRVVPVSATSIPPAGTSWTGSATRSLQSARVGGVDFHVANAAIASHQYSVDGGTPIGVAGTTLRDASPFDRGGVPALLGLTNVATPVLVLFPDLRVATSQTLTIAPPLTARYVSMAAGTGVLSTLTGDLLSPLPDPARVAQVWRTRTGVPALMTDRVHCLDARWCAAISGAGVVFLYENAAAPTVAVLPAEATAGATVRLFADAGDIDGDPLFLSWSAAGATLTPVVGSDDGLSIDVTVPTDAVCGPFAVDVTPRDGLHATPSRVFIEIVGRGVLQTLGPSAPVYAGGPPVRVSAFLDGGCDLASLSWLSDDGQDSGVAQFDWRPPATVCNAAGAQVTLTATAAWAKRSPPTSTAAQQVTVLPWGTPEVPRFTQPATQVGGTSVTWTPVDSQHACVLSGGFPGTELLWGPIDAGAIPVTALDGGLRIEAPECFSGQVIASARRRVVGEQHGRISDAGLLVVNLTANVPALGAATPFGVTAAVDAGSVFGGLSVSASCLDQRTVSAEVSVLDGTTTVQSGVFAVDGGWSLPVAPGCVGGRRDIVARLLEDGGFTGATATAQVSLAANVPALGATTPFMVTAAADAGLLWGGFAVSASCLDQRTLSAEVSVLDGTTTIQSDVFALDGGWSIPVTLGCVGERRDIVARLLEDGGFTGATATAQVIIAADVPALGATTPFMVTAAADAGILSGGFAVSASCLDQRTLSAEVSVLDGPTTVATEVFALGGGWSLPVPGGCAGGRRDIVARLLEDGGFTGAVASAQVELSVLPVAVGAQGVARTDARCGAGVQAAVSLSPVDGACQATETSWRVISGPALAAASGTGTTFALQSQATDFSTVGQQLVIEWTVDGGGSNLATERRTIDIGVQAFVEVSVRSSPALHLEESAIEFEVSLRNTTACAVQGLKVEVPLRGATPLPGAVLVDGVKATARIDGSTLVLEDLTLPADGRTVVRVGARARLLAIPGAEPIASLGGLLVSTSAPGASAPTGCGCSSTGSMLAACLLVLARRRRREE